MTPATPSPSGCGPSEPHRTAERPPWPPPPTYSPYQPANLTTAQAVALITSGLRTTAQSIRDVHDDIDAEDPSTSDLLHATIDQIEKQAWMLSAETRVP